MTIKYLDGKRINTSLEYNVHTFTSHGNSTFAVTGSGDVEYLVIAGGAGGGHGGSHEPAGGGGAGGFLTNVGGSGLGVTAQSYTVTVGTGGASAASDQSNGTNGVNSVFSTITATGGGGAASGTANSGNASNGGSGGGGSAITGSHIGGTGVSGQGFAGGTGYRAPDYEAGGGGGSSEVGESPVSGAARGGNGGNGLQSSINGTATYYAGGGGGGVEYAETAGAGGRGGGGNGGIGNGGNGSNATGYGSGGGGGDNQGEGGNGSAGIVIIRYKTDSGITATGGTITTVSESETKPTNVEDGSILVEENTGKRYLFTQYPTAIVSSGGEWNKTGKQYPSMYESMSSLDTVKKQHFVEWFSGKQLPSYWTTGTIVGSPTSYMKDEIDGGFVLSSVNPASNVLGYINFNNKTQYDPRSSVCISVFKGSRIIANNNFQVGTSNTNGNSHSILSGSHSSYTTNNFQLLTGDGSITSTESTVPLDVNYHLHKIENSLSNAKLYLDGNLAVTKTTNRPTLVQQPYAESQAWGSGGSVLLNIKYMEVYNV